MKVDTLKFVIDGEEFTSNINVNKSGEFSCELHWKVVNALGLKCNKYYAKKLSEITSEINEKHHAYREAKKVTDLFILIEFKAAGCYHKFMDKSSEYTLQELFGNDAIMFTFKVYIRETSSTGVVTWYDTRKTDEGYEKHGTLYSVRGKLIPFTDKALETLKKAQEGIEKISDILYNFINQDEKQIMESLNSGNLLTEKNQ